MNPVANRKVKKNRSMGKTIVQAMVPMLILVPVLIGLMFQSMAQAREIVYKYIEDTVRLRAEQMGAGILKMNNEMISSLGDYPDLITMPENVTPRDSTYYPILFRIMERNRNLKIRYPEAFSFYVYVEKPDILIGDKGVYYRTSDAKGLYRALLEKFRENHSDQTAKTEWMLFTDGNTNYLCSRYYGAGIVQGSIIQLDSLFETIRINSLGYQGIPFLLLPNVKEEEVKSEQIILAHMSDRNQYDFQLLLDQGAEKLKSIPFSGIRNSSLYMIITRDSSVLDQLFTLQLALTITTTAIGLCFLIGIGLYYKKILLPMKQFVAGLKNIGEEQWIHSFEGNDILELEMASKEFKSLLRKIKKLRIQVYEKELERQQVELEKQKIELEYVQEQLKPHFYLNCLNLINTMASAHGEEEIVHITEKMSLCMRYVIKDSFEMSLLAKELDFVKSYVEIQRLRYGEKAFRFELFLDEGMDKMEIPSLLLQTFVENAISHGITLEKEIEITLYAVMERVEDKERAYICISDTGKGFSEETLKAIEENRPIYYGERKHIGIQNAIKRLQVIYGTEAQIRLSNMAEKKGAVVELFLPVKKVTDVKND